MGKKYDSYIELAPGYESVVDINSDNRNTDFWSHYIVNDDIVQAVNYLGHSLHPDDPEEIKHFWLKGAYGTGKTYAAIVLKHLLQDDYNVVENFLNKNPLFGSVKERFLSARKKGKYFVDFRSGECKQLDTSTKLLIQLESSVRKILNANGLSYTGTGSIIDQVCESVRKFKTTLKSEFDANEIPQLLTYDDFETFYTLVQNRDVDACSTAQSILFSMNIGLATDLNSFKEWVKDVINGNPELRNTGIFVIWDEFTEYIRNNDLDIIQQLSLLSKDVPFFVIYVMHEYPGLFSDDVSSGLGKADARFHKIDVSLNEKTTLKLIGESIIVKSGMRDAWTDICDNILYDSIKSNVYAYMGDPDSDMSVNTLKKIFPIHPMTVALVSKVAGLAASNRSIFQFLKSSDSEGFRAYIREQGPYDWKWVTPDYLWDYYFVNNQGGKKDISKLANDALKHYENVYYQISDQNVLRVFKVAMLLLATVGNDTSMRKSKSSKGIRATEKTLQDCFCGILSKNDVNQYLKVLSGEGLNLIVLASDAKEISRIELPYSSAAGELDDEIEKLKAELTPSVLFASGYFGSELKRQFVPEERAVVKRLSTETCWGEKTTTINSKLSELCKNIEKTPYRFGLLLVAVPNVDSIDKIKSSVFNSLNNVDVKSRVLVCVMKTPLDQERLSYWYQYEAKSRLAQKTGSTANASQAGMEAQTVFAEWLGEAIGKPMLLLYNDNEISAFSNKDVLARYEKFVFQVFPASPEKYFKMVTLYKTSTLANAYFGIKRVTLETKNIADDRQKTFNQQWQSCVSLLRDVDPDIWNCKTIDDVKQYENTLAGKIIYDLIKFISNQLSSGTTYLDDLWQNMQSELGYYNAGIFAYLLGFVMHFYLGKYTWFDGNNSHRLDENTAPTMILNILSGKTSGMKLASESDTEKNFKSFTCNVLTLNTSEVGDIFDCAKQIKVKLSKLGAPLWVLKYLPDDKYSGIKEDICKVIDLYTEFILESRSRIEVVEDVVSFVKPKTRLYRMILPNLLRNETMQEGLTNFIFAHAHDAQELCEKYNFSIKTLVSMLEKSRAEEKWQWKENDIENALPSLVLDLRLVGIVNVGFKEHAESIDKVRTILENFFSQVIVPGCVYNKFNDSWAKAVQQLHEISTNHWVSYSIDEKCQIVELLEDNIEIAVENLRHPLNVLKRYMHSKGMSALMDSEYDDILESLERQSYLQPEYSFNEAILKKVRSLEYSKKATKLLQIWRDKTGTDDVSAWCNKYFMPLSWVKNCDAFGTISAIKRGELVDHNKLEFAIRELEQADLDILSDPEALDRIFVRNIASDKYLSVLASHVGDIKKKIKAAGFNNCSKWGQSLADIRSIVSSFIVRELKSEVSEKAKQKLNKIKDPVALKAKIDKLLDVCPEACISIINEE